MDPSTANWQHLVAQYIKTGIKPLIVIVGQTTSGKTSFSVKLASHLIAQGFKAEIINADSRQCYRYTNIGTGKIKTEETQGIKHHMLNVLDLKDSSTMYWYKQQTEVIIKQLQEKNIIPILVGGSMLYVSSITDDRNNKVEKTKTQLQQSNPTNCLHLGVLKEKELISNNIEIRVNAMFEEGWIQEVKKLLHKDYQASDPGLRSLGYQEIIKHINNELTIKEAKKIIIQKTKKYAKRQRTWWKSDKRIHWIEA
jgi:tRNA dimethylallyltransferase